MKRRTCILVLLTLCLLLPSFSMAETPWQLKEKTLYRAEETWWISVSPNGTYLLGYDSNAEESHSSLVLYDTQKQKQYALTWQVSEEEEAYGYLARIAGGPNINSIDVVWSANEAYFTIASYESLVQNQSFVSMLCIGNTKDKTLSVPYTWERKINRDGSALVVNASFTPDASALYFTLVNNGVFSEENVIVRYDLQTGALTPWLSLAGTTSDGQETLFVGREMVAVSDNVFLLYENLQGEFVIARKVNDAWEHQHSLGIHSEARFSVHKLQFSPESGKGILFGQKHANGGGNSVLYTFSLSEQGELLTLEPVPADRVNNAVLSPNGHAALLVLRIANTYNDLSVLNLDEMSLQKVNMPYEMGGSDALEELFFNADKLSRGWHNGCYWGGEFLLTSLYEQQVYVMESAIAETVCRNSMYQPPKKTDSSASPVGVYNVTKAVFSGEELEIGPEHNEATLTLEENGSVTLEGYLADEELFLSGAWSLDGELLLINFPEEDITFMIFDHEGYTKLLLSSDYAEYLFEP